jgi:GT2 family glycosyltransferase
VRSFPWSRLQTPQSPDPWVSAVIVNYNAWPDVVRLVLSLAGTPEVAGGTAEVVLVDNASQGPTPPELVNPAPGVQLAACATNAGFAAGVNAGWSLARGRWLLVLNPDIVVPEGFLAAVIARVLLFEANPSRAPGVVGFGLRNPDGSRQPSVGAFPSLPRTLWEQLIPRSRRKYQADWRTRPGPVPWVTGACMLVNTQLLTALGGMDDDFFLYYEEVALCRSALALGKRVEFDPSLCVTHLRPLQNRTLSPKMRVITRHSKLLYFRKHLPHWQFILLSWLITIEAQIHGQQARCKDQSEEMRSWRTIQELAVAFRAGKAPHGRAVQALAEAVTRRVPEPEAEPLTTDRQSAGARKQRGAGTLK